jgi:hypothetical protein
MLQSTVTTSRKENMIKWVKLFPFNFYAHTDRLIGHQHSGEYFPTTKVEQRLYLQKGEAYSRGD